MRILKRYFSVFHTNLSKHAFKLKENQTIKSWQIHGYGDITELKLVASQLPVIRNPDDVLVKVSAASLNPIDFYMLSGYGRALFQVQRNFESEFPLTLGRDFSGTVIAKGHAVGDHINIGEEVYGFIPIHKQGSFSEMILANKNHVSTSKTKTFRSHTECFIDLCYDDCLERFVYFWKYSFKTKKGLRVLILGASGGVGTVAVQLLKSQDCVVYGTCSTDAVPLVHNLGADRVFDYKDPDFEKQVELEGRYHIILDGAKIGYQNIPQSWKHDTFITLNSPLLIYTDYYGIMGGLVLSLNHLLEANLSRYKNGSSVKWGFFVPSRIGFEFIDKLICAEKIRPVIHKTFKFEELPDAFKTLSDGHLRGKIVIDFDE
ncbi:hypothetical protein NQ317_003159 [Molorchus minor]|uniref:Enoyl reductase (ER) domain-containing protein n=1 Tax=Molorchus minor TaxID=1323400 RepID=A0ABQ9JZ30_9CUCU|nr:hypothetical protein NQ317_003159 [Molorchus minor]